MTLLLKASPDNNQLPLFTTTPTPEMEPRKLTEGEIKDIVDSLDGFYGATEGVRNYVKKYIGENLAIHLRAYKITPLGIPELKEIIIRRYMASKVSPGKMVGIESAEALGGPLTQLTLNSFHTSGAKRSIAGTDRIKEIIHASPNPKAPSCTIVFEDENLSARNILVEMRPKIVGVTVESLLARVPDIESYDNIIGEEEPDWYDDYRIIVGPIHKSSWMMRLQLDVSSLIKYKIPIEKVAQTISGQSTNIVYTVYSSIDIGIIDVYPDDQEVLKAIKNQANTKFTNQAASLIFLTKTLKLSLNKMQIQGISGITAIYPVETVVWNVIKDEILIRKDPLNGDLWHLLYDRYQLKISGISRQKVRKLCEEAGLKIVPFTQEQINSGYHLLYLAVRIPEDMKDLFEFDNALDLDPREKNKMNPGQIVQYQIKTTESEVEKKLKKIRELSNQINLIRTSALNQNRKLTLVEEQKIIKIKDVSKTLENRVEALEKTGILKSGKFYHAESDGSNMTRLFMDDYVNFAYTYSNNMYEIIRLLGIEAMRFFLIKEIYEVLAAEDAYINRRHIVLLADYMCRMGDVSKVTFSGVKKQETGVLALASFQRALDTINNASTFGTVDPVTGPSISIYLGQKGKFGTGYNPNMISKEMLNQVQVELEEDNITPLDVDDIEQGVNELNQEFDMNIEAPGNMLEALIGKNPITTVPLTKNPVNVLNVVNQPEGLVPSPSPTQLLPNLNNGVVPNVHILEHNLDPINNATCVKGPLPTTKFTVIPEPKPNITTKLPVFEPMTLTPLAQTVATQPVLPDVVVPSPDMNIGVPKFLNNLIKEGTNVKLPKIEKVTKKTLTSGPTTGIQGFMPLQPLNLMPLPKQEVTQSPQIPQQIPLQPVAEVTVPHFSPLTLPSLPVKIIEPKDQ